MSHRPDGDLTFPRGFLLGCASAAHQVEGGQDNDWTEFERCPGTIADGAVSGIACDHYRRYRDDLMELAGHGQNAHRFSLEWSRIEPEEGRFDRSALAHYRDVIMACREFGLEPIVTLHHYTLPRWLAARGGLLAPAMPRWFARYAAVCAATFGDRVRWWVTVNEPTVLATLGYLFGEWPPRQTSLPNTFRAMRALIRMHAAGRRAIRAAAAGGPPPRVGVAHHERPLRARRRGATAADRWVATLPNYLFNRWFLRSCCAERLLAPAGHGERVPGAALDYIGVNYYCEEVVAFDRRNLSALFATQVVDAELPRSSFPNTTIDPPAFTRNLLALWREFHLPLLITENGVADSDDELRPRFLVEHLAAVHDAIREGAEITGYLHWTALDNFEWKEGYGQKFGLFRVDRRTMARHPKRSAEIFARICAVNGVPGDLLHTLE